MNRRDVLVSGLASVVLASVPRADAANFKVDTFSDSSDKEKEGAYISKKIWTALINELKNISSEIVSQYDRIESDLEKHEAIRYLLRVFEGMRLFGLESNDPEYPSFHRVFDTNNLYGNANADALYFHASISCEHTYRITGKRGSAHIVEVQTMSEGFVSANQKGLRTLNIDSHGGEVEIILSSKPKGRNWLKLDKKARFLYLRQYFYDWTTEEPGDFIIERLGAMYPPPSSSGDDIKVKLQNIVSAIPSWYQHIKNLTESHYRSEINSLNFMQSPSAMADQYYGNGYYDLSSDEALVIVFKQPECNYWSVQLLNHLWETLEFDLRQSSINGYQAYYDASGIFYGVISPVDPGYLNWLDTGGRMQGLISLRVLKTKSRPEAKLQVVKFADLDKVIPSSMPMLTKQERSDIVKQRMLDVRKRYRQ
ncbi:MAG: hypothetical protein WC997_11325 [Porticoccaceae bacterium]